MDHAQPPTGARQRQSLRGWWLNVVSAMFMTSCVVLPPTADPPAAVPPILQIKQVSPEQFTPFLVINPTQGTDSQFRVNSVFTQGVDPSTLHYSWYYDWDASQTVLDIAAVCRDKNSCDVLVCTFRNPGAKEHTLLAVVSSAVQLGGAVTPTDFPPGVVWDSVEWRIQVTGNICVQ